MIFELLISIAASATEFKFGKMKIDVTQTASNANGQRDGAIKVLGGRGANSEKQFKAMESLGGSNGFSLPNKQPRKDLFLIVKEGDYDDRLLIVTQKGELLDLPFGNVSADAKTLYSLRTDDEAEKTAYGTIDLKTMKAETGDQPPQDIVEKARKARPLFKGLFYQNWHPLSK